VSFRGWKPEALDFFEGLEADNSKPYWLAHKDTYEREVKAPMEALLAELAPEYGEYRLFRPYRDVRFSRDKSPYRTNIAATIGHGYVHLSADGLRAGAGMYHLAPDQLERYRLAVDKDASGGELRNIVDLLRGSGVEVYGSDALKLAPKGYAKDHPRVELLRYRGIVAMRAWPVEAWLGTSKAKQRVADLLRETSPLVGWLERHVGESTLPVDERGRR